MEKLDRLGWTAGMSFTAYGTRFGIRANDPGVLEQVLPHLPLGWAPDSSPTVDFLYSVLAGGPGKHKGIRRYNLLYAGAGRLIRTLDMAEVFAHLESHLELFTAYLAKDYLFVHAGVVGWQGQAILIPGRSFSGKTTLVSALVKAGATYYSDEYAILDPHGRVRPYPVPLSLRDETGRSLKKSSIEALGGQAGVEPLPVGLVVVTEYQPEAQWQPRKLSPAHAMLALMDNTVAARRGPELSMPILKQVALEAETIESKRGEAQTVAPQLLNYITARRESCNTPKK
jgi:hypothetical protein